ncbi:unnamed protein product [Pylaiella littoralis]
MSVATVLSFVLVGACWGCTTPLIKDGTSAKLEDNPRNTQQPAGSDSSSSSSNTTVTEETRLGKVLAPLQSLASVKAAIPFALNQSGSALFYYLLSAQDISTAVPVCNALSLVFTAATAMWLGEKVHHPLRTLSGMVLVLVGLAVCVASKEKLLSR